MKEYHVTIFELDIDHVKTGNKRKVVVTAEDHVKLYWSGKLVPYMYKNCRIKFDRVIDKG